MNISLGIDQIGNDYLENIKLATLNGQLRMSLLQQYSKAKMRKPLVTDTVHAATLGGAKMLRRDDLGRLAPGAEADLCTVDVTKPLGGVGALPPEPLHHLLYSSGRNVRDVMINGRFKVQNGNLMVANEDRVVAEGGEAAKKIWDWCLKRRIGLTRRRRRTRADKDTADRGWTTPRPRQSAIRPAYPSNLIK